MLIPVITYSFDRQKIEKDQHVKRKHTVSFEARLLIQPVGNYRISQEAANYVPLSAK